MLKGLFDVHWEQLEHAYGLATDTPLLLLKLLSKSQTEFNEAIDELYASICHQGTVYTATPAAIPFVIDVLLRTKQVGRQLKILQLLKDIGVCDLYANRDQPAVAYIVDEDLTLEELGDILRNSDDWKSLIFGKIEENIISQYKLLQNIHHCHHALGLNFPHLINLYSMTRNPLCKIAILEILAGYREYSDLITHVLLLWQFDELPLNNPTVNQAIETCLASLNKGAI